MTRQEQIDFVSGLVSDVAENVILAIHEGRVPSDWGGHELRCLLKRLFEHENGGWVPPQSYQETVARNRLG